MYQRVPSLPIPNGTSFRTESTFFRIACIASDGTVHAAPRFSRHQPAPLTQCPPPSQESQLCSPERRVSLQAGPSEFGDGSLPAARYENRMDCAWTFTARPGEKVKIHFDRFSVERHTDCRWDYVLVGSTRYCGSSLPPVLVLPSPATVRFHTDASVRLGGFRAVAESVTPTAVQSHLCSQHKFCSDCVSDASSSCAWCGATSTCMPSVDDQSCPSSSGSRVVEDSSQCHCKRQTSQPQLLTASSGMFEDGSGDSRRRYLASGDCRWRVSIPANQKLLVNFTKFSVEAARRCRYDYLQIADEPRLCGWRRPEPICIANTGSSAITKTMHFHTDSSVQWRGFVANYYVGDDVC